MFLLEAEADFTYSEQQFCVSEIFKYAALACLIFSFSS